MDALKIHLEDLLLAVGVRLLYASVVVGIQQQAGALQGVVIGNKSGWQVIQCHLLIDTSETALVARVLGEAFQHAPTALVPYRRTLEYDNVATDLALDQPVCFDGPCAVLHAGYRGTGHVLVECALDLPFVDSDAFDLSERESLARERTMAFAAELAQEFRRSRPPIFPARRMNSTACTPRA